MKGVIISNGSNDLGRKKDLIFNLSYYLHKKGGDISVVTSDEFRDTWASYDFIYKPITVGDIASIEGERFNLPVMIDRADSKAPTMMEVFDRYLIRTAFGQSKNSIKSSKPTSVIPLVPPPISDHWVPPEIRDVICIDLKPFHERSTVLAAASILAVIIENYDRIINLLGFSPKFYFTSFFDSDIVLDIVNKFVPNVNRPWSLESIIPDIIPPANKPKDYHSILDRCFLFITEHGDIADWDVSYCLQTGCRILPFQRGSLGITTGVQCSIPDAWAHYSKVFLSEIQRFQRNSFSMHDSIEYIFNPELEVSPFDRQCYVNIYLNSIEDGFSFMFNNRKAKIFNIPFISNSAIDSSVKVVDSICTKGFKWNKGVSYRN